MLLALLVGCAAGLAPDARAEVMPGWSTVECEDLGTGSWTATLGDELPPPVLAWTRKKPSGWDPARDISYHEGVLTIHGATDDNECLVYVAG